MPTETMVRTTLPKISQFAKDGREQLLRHVRADISELEGELKTLKETERALKGNGSTAARPTNGARTTSRRPARRRAASSRTLTEAMVMQAIRSGHQRSSAIAAATGSTASTVGRRLQGLHAKAMLKRTGTGAQTRWMLTEKGMAAKG